MNLELLKLLYSQGDNEMHSLKIIKAINKLIEIKNMLLDMTNNNEASIQEIIKLLENKE